MKDIFGESFSYEEKRVECRNCGSPMYYHELKADEKIREEYRQIIKEIVEEQEEIFKAHWELWPNLPIRPFLTARGNDFGRYLYLSAQKEIRELTNIEKIELDSNLNNLTPPKSE